MMKNRHPHNKCSCGNLKLARSNTCIPCFQTSRPRIYSEVNYVRLDKETNDEINNIAKELKTTKSEAIRCVIQWGLELVELAEGEN